MKNAMIATAQRRRSGSEDGQAQYQTAVVLHTPQRTQKPKQTRKKHRKKSDASHIPIGYTPNRELVSLHGVSLDGHIHEVGSTGTGKSKFIEWFCRRLIQAPRTGFCLLDPHGSTYLAVLRYMAEHHPSLAKRVLIFDPAWDLDVSFSYNPITSNAKTQMDMLIPHLVSSTLKSWGQDDMAETPRIARTLDNVYYTLIENGLTLLEALPLIATGSSLSRERDVLLAKVSDLLVRDDLLYLSKSGVREKKSELEGVANRLRSFLRSDRIKRIIGSQMPSMDLKKMMDESTILLVNLSGNGQLSFEHTKLLGSLLLSDFFRHAKNRNHHDPHLRPYYLMVDEFAHFVTRDVARALEECRKFGLRLLLSHQHLAQLKTDDEYIFSSVMTNCKNKVVFGATALEDCEILAAEVFSGHLDHLKVKDEITHQVVQHREETRESRSHTETRGESDGTTSSISKQEMTSQSRSHAVGESASRNNTVSSTASVTKSASDGTSQSQSLTRSKTETWSNTEGVHSSVSRSESSGTSTAEIKTKADGTSTAHSAGKSTSTSEGSSIGTSSGTSVGTATSFGHGANTGVSGNTGVSQNQMIREDENGALVVAHNASASSGQGFSSSTSVSENHSSSQSTNASKNQSTSRSRAESESTTTSMGHFSSTGSGQSTGVSQSVSTGTAEGVSIQNGHSIGEGYAEGRGETVSQQDGIAFGKSRGQASGTGESHTTTDGVTEGQSHGSGATDGKSTQTSTSTSEGITVSPFLTPEYTREVGSRTYWSLQELRYFAASHLKNLPTGTAVIRLDGTKPVTTQIMRVPSLGQYNASARKMVDRFITRVIEAHPDRYIPHEALDEQVRKRQMAIFGHELKYEDPSTNEKNRPPNPENNTDDTNPFG